MFFWKTKMFLTYDYRTVLKASLRACHKQIDPKICDNSKNPIRKKSKKAKRTFFLTPSSWQASVCLEASLSFSFFLLFFVNLFSLIFLFMIYTQEMVSLQQQGKQLAAYAYVTEGMFTTKEENIHLQKVRKVDSPFTILAAPECRLSIKCVVKPWTGYDVVNKKNREEEDQIVYMTQNGSVYHKNRSCSHLSLSIRAVSSMAVKEKRNESGECYTPCEYCGEQGVVTVVFITSYGNRYHTTIKCQGLKRSVKSIRLSEVEGINPCHICG